MEIANKRSHPVIDGIYSITYRGLADWGLGMLILQGGSIIGADAGGVIYDGNYAEVGQGLQFSMTITVPPGVPLVQGTPARSTTYTVPIEASVPKSALDGGQPVLINLPNGPVNVLFRRIRTLN